MGLFKIGQAGLAGNTTTTVNLPAGVATDYLGLMIIGRIAGVSATHSMRFNSISSTTYYRNFSYLDNTTYGKSYDTGGLDRFSFGETLSSSNYLSTFVMEINNIDANTRGRLSGTWQFGNNQSGSTGIQRWGAFYLDADLTSDLTSISILSTSAPTFGIFYIYGVNNA